LVVKLQAKACYLSSLEDAAASIQPQELQVGVRPVCSCKAAHQLEQMSVQDHLPDTDAGLIPAAALKSSNQAAIALSHQKLKKS
jgi:hypothetical protein